MTHFKFFTSFSIASLFLLCLTSVSCNKDEQIEEEQELITTVQVKFIGSGFTKTFTWEDKDGDGGNLPTIQTIELPEGTGDIICELTVLDRSTETERDLTAEIISESNEHLFTFFHGPSLVIAYDDRDSNDKEFGQKTRWFTLWEPSSSDLTIKLLHKPNKNNVVTPGGAEDFSITFPIVLK